MYADGENWGATNVSTAASSATSGGGAGRIGDRSAAGSILLKCSAARSLTAQSLSVNARVSTGRAAAGSTATSASSAAARATYRPSRPARDTASVNDWTAPGGLSVP